MSKELQVESIRQRILSEFNKYGKHDYMDWARIAAGKIYSSLKEQDQPRAATPSGKGEQPQGESRTNQVTNELLSLITPEMQEQINYAMSLEESLTAARERIAELENGKKHSIHISDGTVFDLTGATPDTVGKIYLWVTEAEHRIATLEAKRKDIAREAWDAGMKRLKFEILVMSPSEKWRGKTPPNLATYLTRFDKNNEDAETDKK